MKDHSRKLLSVIRCLRVLAKGGGRETFVLVIDSDLSADINECIVGHQVCGYGAECVNLPGSHQCVCPHGYGGDPYNGLCSPAQKRCINDNECKANEKCVQPGECVCPPPFYTDPLDGDHCKSKESIAIEFLSFPFIFTSDGNLFVRLLGETVRKSPLRFNLDPR